MSKINPFSLKLNPRIQTLQNKILDILLFFNQIIAYDYLKITIRKLTTDLILQSINLKETSKNLWKEKCFENLILKNNPRKIKVNIWII